MSPFNLFSSIIIFLSSIQLLPLLYFLLLLLDFLFISILLLSGYIFVYLRFISDVCFHMLFPNISSFLTMPPFLPFLLFITFFSLFLSFVFGWDLYATFEDILMGNQLFLLFQMFMLLVEYGSLHLLYALILLLVLFLHPASLFIQFLLADLLLL